MTTLKIAKEFPSFFSMIKNHMEEMPNLINKLIRRDNYYYKKFTSAIFAENLPEKYQEISNKNISKEVYLDAYTSLIVKHRQKGTEVPLDIAKLLIKDLDNDDIHFAFVETIKEPGTKIIEYFLNDSELNKKINFQDIKPIFAALANNVKAIPILLANENFRNLIKDENNGRQILIRCKTNPPLTELMLNEGVNYDYYVKNAIDENSPMFKELQPDELSLRKIINVFQMKSNLETKLPQKDYDPRNERKRKI